MTLFVYILECSDGSYYCGVTNNLERRLAEHNEGIKINSYTFNRRPVKLVYEEQHSDPYYAFYREKQIKGWSRRKKKALIDSNWDDLVKFSNSADKDVNPSTGSG